MKPICRDVLITSPRKSSCNLMILGRSNMKCSIFMSTCSFRIFFLISLSFHTCNGNFSIYLRNFHFLDTLVTLAFLFCILWLSYYIGGFSISSIKTLDFHATQSNYISLCIRFCLFTLKTYFFYFTHPFLQNTHISLSILHIYLIKYSFFYNFLLLSLIAPLSHRPTLPHRPKPNTLSQT